MKSFRIFFLKIFFILFVFGNIQAANWHPFPFKISYYGKSLTQEENYCPLFNQPVKSKWVNALYLDYSNGNERTNSNLYPLLEGATGNISLSLFWLSTKVVTTTDSQQVTVSGDIESQVIKGIYLPKRVRTGDSPHGIVLKIELKQVLGVSDSVATLALGGDTLWWSKSFGICRVKEQSDEITLVGIKDINLGIQDLVFKVRPPQAGDEIHIWQSANGTISCNGPLTGNFTESENINQLKRFKYLASGEVEVIVSEFDSSTGTIFSIPGTGSNNLVGNGDSVLPIGLEYLTPTANLCYFLGFIGPDGVFSKVAQSIVYDVPLKTTFLTCANMGEYSISASIPPFLPYCSGAIVRFQYPKYVKVAGGCNYGQPLPAVTITESGRLFKNENIRVVPQPVNDFFQFEGISQGTYILRDLLGKVVSTGLIDNNKIQVSLLKSGIYLYEIRSNGKKLMGKLVKD